MFSELICKMQQLEYCRSFTLSRIFFDSINATMIISGAFGLFQKDIVISLGGYDTSTVGEDMELVLRLHDYCATKHMKYKITYAMQAVCHTQVPDNIRDLFKQRMRWQLGLIQSLERHLVFRERRPFAIRAAYAYFVIYELFAPIFATIWLLARLFNTCNCLIAACIFTAYTFTGVIISKCALLLHNRIYTQKTVVKSIWHCFLETAIYQLALIPVRSLSLIALNKKQYGWKHPTRR